MYKLLKNTEHGTYTVMSEDDAMYPELIRQGYQVVYTGSESSCTKRWRMLMSRDILNGFLGHCTKI